MALLKPSSNQLPVDLVKKELKQVEAQIRDQVRAFDSNVEPYIDYICNTSGKRIRPVLSIIAGGATGGVKDEHIKIGVILELIHMATLVHDDIIDGADTRRKVPTANAKWGNGMAVLLGDALFSHSLMLATEFGDISICQKVGRASRDVCEGEVMQTQRRFDPSLSVQDYYTIIEKKTGALFAAATGIAAALSGVSAELEAKLYDYGMKLGTAYQIYDDCLDMVGTDEGAGKTLRTDMEKGKFTLPMFYILDAADKSQTKLIKERISNEQPLDLEAVVGIDAYVAAVEKALDKASEMLRGARDNLTDFDDSKYRDGFVQITHYLDNLLSKCRAE